MKSSDSSDYLPRVADQQLSAALRTSGAVLIQGPKWCGKTATGSQAAASIIYLQDPDHSAAYLQLADLKPSALLEGEVPRLIDEWLRRCGTPCASLSIAARHAASSS